MCKVKTIQTRSMKVDANRIYNYYDVHGFEIRHGVTKNYNSLENDRFELRIQHDEPEQIEALLEKIKEWMVDKK